MLPVVGGPTFQHLPGACGQTPSCQGTAGAVSPQRGPCHPFPLYLPCLFCEEPGMDFTVWRNKDFI